MATFAPTLAAFAALAAGLTLVGGQQAEVGRAEDSSTEQAQHATAMWGLGQRRGKVIEALGVHDLRPLGLCDGGRDARPMRQCLGAVRAAASQRRPATGQRPLRQLRHGLYDRRNPLLRGGLYRYRERSPELRVVRQCVRRGPGLQQRHMRQAVPGQPTPLCWRVRECGYRGSCANACAENERCQNGKCVCPGPICPKPNSDATRCCPAAGGTCCDTGFC